MVSNRLFQLRLISIIVCLRGRPDRDFAISPREWSKYERMYWVWDALLKFLQERMY